MTNGKIIARAKRLNITSKNLTPAHCRDHFYGKPYPAVKYALKKNEDYEAVRRTSR